MTRHLAWLALLAALAGALPAAAHPHVWIEHKVKIVFGDRAPEIHMSWSFDEMYSSMLREDYVKSRGATLTADEVRTIEKKNFANLANYNYFITLSVNGKPVAVKNVKDFTVHFEGEKAVYEFTVPLPPPVPGQNAFEIAAFDQEYYVEFTLLPKGGLTVENGEPAGASCEIVGDTKIAELYGAIDSDTVRCSFKGKP
jgi:ABC-type uncharacterized transport system substrate-binding protein